jgi:hypothetical protein
MGFFSTEITDSDAQAASDTFKQIEQIPAEHLTKDLLKEKLACTKLIARYNEQQKEAEENFKSGLNTALSIIKRFLPKEIRAKIPPNAIELLFGFFHQPEILVDKMNHEWECMCRQIGIPSEHIRIIMQKAGINADVEAIIGIYNPKVGQWKYLDYSFRQAIEAVRGQGGTINIRSDIQEAYGIQVELNPLTTPVIELSENNSHE